MSPHSFHLILAVAALWAFADGAMILIGMRIRTIRDADAAQQHARQQLGNVDRFSFHYRGDTK